MAKEKSRTSRVGKRPIILPKGVAATIGSDKVEVKGPKGTLWQKIPAQVSVQQEGETIHVTSSATRRDGPRLQGLMRALIASMVKGVTEGYEKRLELHGTGYRGELKGQVLHLSLGLSHPVEFTLPTTGLSIEIPKDSKGTLIIIKGTDKQVVGQAAATIRGNRPPSPYGGKGVRYKGEHVRLKAGKAGSAS
jgi:large subunit ribosomal protein L6